MIHITLLFNILNLITCNNNYFSLVFRSNFFMIPIQYFYKKINYSKQNSKIMFKSDYQTIESIIIFHNIFKIPNLIKTLLKRYEVFFYSLLFIFVFDYG